MEQWENNYYISAIAGSNNGSSLVVMSKGKSFLVCSLGMEYFIDNSLLDCFEELFA